MRPRIVIQFAAVSFLFYVTTDHPQTWPSMYHGHCVPNISVGVAVPFGLIVSPATSCHIAFEKSAAKSKRKESQPKCRAFFRFQNIAQQNSAHCVGVNSMHRTWHLHTDCAFGT